MKVNDRDGVRLPFAADLTSQGYGGGIRVVFPFKPLKIR